MIKIQEQVKEIQEEIFSKSNDIILSYTEHGYVKSVKLHFYLSDLVIDVDLWNDQDDSRKFNEEDNDYEDFKVFIRRKVEECIESFKELRFILR